MFFRAKTKFLAQILLTGLVGFGMVGSLSASENQSEAKSEILTHQTEVDRVLLQPVASDFDLDQLDFSISNTRLVAQKEISKSTSKPILDFGSGKNGIVANLSASEFHFLAFSLYTGCRAIVQSNPSQNSFKDTRNFVFATSDFSHSLLPENFVSSLSEHSSALSSIPIFSVGCLSNASASKESISSEAAFSSRDSFDRVRTFVGERMSQVVLLGLNAEDRKNRGQWQGGQRALISEDWAEIREMSELQDLSERFRAVQENGDPWVIGGKLPRELKTKVDLLGIFPLIRIQTRQPANVGILGESVPVSGFTKAAFILESQNLVENSHLQNNEILSGGLSTNGDNRKSKLSFQVRPNFDTEIRS